MKRKWCRALGIILSVCMLSGDLGTIAVSAAGDPAAVSAEAVEEADSGEETDAPDEGTEAAEDEAGQKEGEPAEETPAEGGEAVSENDAETEEGSEEESASENEAEKEEASEGESASENEAEKEEASEGESASENEAEEGESASENEAEEGVSDEETVSVNEAEEAEEETDDGNADYQVVISELYSLSQTSVEAGSYSAAACVEFTASDYNYPRQVAVIFTDDKDADFFPGVKSVSRNDLASVYKYTDYVYSYNDGYEWHYDDNSETYTFKYKIQLVDYSSYNSFLTPDTEYTCRIVQYDGWDSANRDYMYSFLSKPVKFSTGPEVTEPTVKLKEARVESGYYQAYIKVFLDNPNNEDVQSVKVASKNVSENEAGYWSEALYPDYDYDDDNNRIDYYGGSFYTAYEGEPEILIGVRTGKDGAIKYAKSDLTYEKRDIKKDAKITISANAVPELFKVVADASIEPFYSADNDIKLVLYYRKKGASYYYSDYDYGDEGTFSIARFLEAGETEYEYYAEIKAYDGQDTVIIANDGSKDAPKSFTTGKLVTYTKEDFKDPGLYAYVSSNYGTITNATLSGITYLSIYSIYDNTPIKSLDDIPDKFPNITELYIQGQDITDIAPLLECKYLKEVNLNYNDIATLPDLSAVSWERLSLNYNKLSKAAVVAANIPTALSEYADEWVRTARKDVLNSAQTYYIDSDGVYPLILEWLGRKNGRSYTVSISVNDISKKYNMNNEVLVIKTAKDDFGFEEGKNYTAKISINDSISDVYAGEISFSFKAASYETEDYYMISSDTWLSVNCNLTTDYAKNYKRSELVRDGKVYMKGSYVSNSTNNMTSSIYKGVFNGYISGLNYKCVNVYTSLGMIRTLSEGDYDIYLYPLDDTGAETDPVIISQKVHVAAYPVVEDIFTNPENTDNAGDYIYIGLEGYYLDEKTYPSVIDANGNSYTKYVSYKQRGNTEYIYKLQKQNWDTINKSSDDTVYYIRLNGTPKDNTGDAEKKIYAGELKSSGIIELEPVSAFYNWKQKVFEFSFNSTVTKGSKLTVEFIDDEDRSVKKASGSATANEKGHISISPMSVSDNSIYIPKNGTDEYVRISCGDNSATTYVYVRWYNYYGPNEPSQESRLSLSLSKRYLAAPAESIDVYLYASDDRHKTEDISARLLDKNKNVLDTVKLTCTKGDNYNTYKKEAWKFANALAEGSYKIEAYETVDGKDVVLTSSNLYVRNKDNFYASYANGWFRSDDATKATFEVDIAVQDIPQTSTEAELNQLVKDLGLKIEVFDADYKPVTVTVKPTSASSYGYVYFEISGLDKDAYCYYARITSKGKTPLNPNTDKEYYTDKDHGEMFTRSSYNLGLEDNSTLNAYYYIYFGGYKAAEILPLTVSFYPLADPNTLVKTFTIKEGDIKNNTYMFTKSDVDGLDEKTVYNCIVSTKTKSVSSYTGYFTYQQDSKPVPVTGVSISQGKTYSLAVGSTVQLTAVIAPSNANQYTGLSWSSSNAKVATVDASGLVTAVAEGKANITVKTENSKTATCAVTVTDGRIRVTGVKIAEGTSASVKPGETLQLTAEFTPADATEKGVTWSSSDTSVATVSDTGLVTATAKEGKSVISVKTTDGGFTASCVVKVTSGIVKVSGIRINEGSSITLDPGAEKKLTYTITPADAADKTVTWSTSDPAIVTVSANGSVKAVADSGTATISVKANDGDYSAKCTVTILNKADYVYAEFVDGDEYVYTGSAITPEIAVYNGDQELVYGVDYTVAYKNNTNVNATNDPKKAATVTVTGKTFAGSMTQTFTILPADLNDADVTCSDIIRIKKNTKPAPVIYYKNVKLAAKDYDVTYDAAAVKGKYMTDGSLTITGKGNFTGTRDFTVLITTPVNIKVTKFKVAARTYNGEAQVLDPSEYTVSADDFEIVYLTDNVNAGTVKVAFIGTGEYTGTVIKTFKINPDKNVVPDVDVAASAAYTPTGALPAVNVSLNGKELVAGKDYKLSYSGNKKITDKAKVTVSFLGNYKGAKSIAKTFAVTAPEITAAGGAVYCADMTYTKAGKYLAAPYVNVNGVVIAKGDYNVTYKINGNDISKAKIDDSYFADSNVVKVDVTIDFNKKTPKFTGTLETSYDIVKAEGYDKTRDLSKAKITITDSETGKKTTSLLYTGQPVELGGRYKLTVTFGNGKNAVTLVEGTDFEIIKESYSNNVNKGKATVVINAKDGSGYFGSKVISFNITNNKGLSWF